MKQIIFNVALIIGLLTFSDSYTQQPEAPKPEPVIQTTPEMRGCIKIVGHSDSMPQFRVVFASGKETMSNSEGFFTFPIDDSNIEHYSLVICKRIQQNFDKKNTLKNVSVVPGKTYRYFSFRKSACGSSWYQQEEQLNKADFVIPPHCIVLLIDPSCVEEVKNWEITLPCNIVKLPMIVLKNKSEQKDLKRDAVKSLLYSLDTTTFHESVRQTSKQPEGNAKVAVSRVQ